MRLGPKMIMGIFLTLLGLSMILNTLFRIDLPVFRIFLACMVIYFGVRMIFGDSVIRVKNDDPNSAVFASRTFKADPKAPDGDKGREYNIVKSKGRVDLTAISLDAGSVDVAVNTVLGEAIVEVSSDTPYKVEAKAVFAESRMPDQNVNVLGSVMYRSENSRGATKLLTIRANTVFGTFRIETRDASSPRAEAASTTSAGN